MVLDRNAFDEWLLTTAENSGVTVMRGCAITGGVWKGNGWILSALVDGIKRTLSGSFVVEATGSKARSVARSEVTRYFSDALVCLAVHLPRQSSERRKVLIESCPEGWWYTVGLPNGSQIVALFTDADLVERTESRLEWFKLNLEATSHIRNYVEEIPTDAVVRVCEARTSVRSVLWRDAFISAGDAAWCLDPLSGTGIERGITDGLAVAAAVSQSLKLGDLEPLRKHAISQFASFRTALAAQRYHYSSETRWANTVFWRRRLEEPAAI
jgi:flavin-dependent dehydrogenase